MRVQEGDSIEDVAFKVCTAMQQAGVTAVLAGGGAAAVHAPRAYVTRDLDFVLHFAGSPPDAGRILALGFRSTKALNIYDHPEIPYTLEFLMGPLAIGEDELSSWEVRRRGDLVLNIISATDSVRDRLAAGIHWRDPNAARQAAAVARANSIDLELVKAWCIREGGASTFAIFERLI